MNWKIISMLLLSLNCLGQSSNQCCQDNEIYGNLEIGHTTQCSSPRTLNVVNDGTAGIRITDAIATTDQSAMVGIEFYRDCVFRMGEISFYDPMDNNLYIVNSTVDGYIEFQTEDVTKVAIDPDGWLQLGTGIWFGSLVPDFPDATSARNAGLQDGMSFIRQSDGALIVLRTGIN